MTRETTMTQRQAGNDHQRPGAGQALDSGNQRPGAGQALDSGNQGPGAGQAPLADGEHKKTVREDHTVAIQGIRGSFHHEAAEMFFREAGTRYIPCMSFRELVVAVKKGRAGFGVMAVENSLVGGMLPNFSLIRDAALHITGEVYMRITQNLMALPGERIETLREVHSHPMAIMQAEDFFEDHPHIRLVESADTAISARLIATDRLKGVGAIASRSAAKIYGLPLLAESIETNRENYTRFLVLGRSPASLESMQPVKASLAFVAPHQPGSLVDILLPLANAGVNLSMLQSLPLVGRSWEYIFHADMVFPDMQAALEITGQLKANLEQIWVMGIYPPGQSVETGTSQGRPENNGVQPGP